MDVHYLCNLKQYKSGCKNIWGIKSFLPQEKNIHYGGRNFMVVEIEMQIQLQMLSL